MLTVNLTGYPQVTLNDNPVPFHTKHEVALLVYLITQAGPHSRRHLGALLWPDRESEYQANSLRVALAHLRALLGPWFTTTRQTVTVDPAMPLTVQWPEQARYFMHGFSLHPAYDAWLTHQRRRPLNYPSARWYATSASTQSHLEQMALRFYQPTLLGDDSALQWAMRHQSDLITAAVHDLATDRPLRACLLLSSPAHATKRLRQPNLALGVIAKSFARLSTIPAFVRASARIIALEQITAHNPTHYTNAFQTLANDLVTESQQTPQDLHLAVHAHQTAAKAATLAGHWQAAADHHHIVVAAVLSQQRPSASYYLADAAVACARAGAVPIGRAYLNLAQTHASGINIQRLINHIIAAQQNVETLLSQT